jgi:beta-D-xylosidase 4
LQTLLRETWHFGDGFVSGDCGAVYGVFNPHHNAATRVGGSAAALLAGTDIDCGTEFSYYLEDAFDQGDVSRDNIEKALTRLYSGLVQQGYFDGNGSLYRDLTWDDVVKTDSWNISYEAAVEGIVLLKNDGTLPLHTNSSVALIGPYANATEQMLGNYFTTPPYVISPLAAFEASGRTINYALGTGISSDNETFFDEALAAARKSDVIVFAGGLDNSVESEALDRENITWPGNQLDLIDRLSKLGKPVVVLQMGGGQVDSSALKANDNVNSLIWGGYPGQSGGQALYDIISGARAPAGRLVTTQYPASYAEDFYQLDMDLRPSMNGSGNNPGQTYMWYTGEAVYQFGHGLFYTTFEEKAAGNMSHSINITNFFAQPHSGYEFIEQKPLLTFTAQVSNTGSAASDYSAMLFASTTSGPTPRPIKWLVGITREAEIAPGGACTVAIDVPVGALARAADNGDLVVYPGDYELALNNERSVVVKFTLTGDAITIAHWPSKVETGGA